MAEVGETCCFAAGYRFTVQRDLGPLITDGRRDITGRCTGEVWQSRKKDDILENGFQLSHKHDVWVLESVGSDGLG